MSHTPPAVLDAAVAALPPVISVRPVVLPAPDRGSDLHVRVTAPSTGSDLPVIVFSHGFGESMDGYALLAEFWAAHGFAVLQPTHLDSQTLGIAPDDSRTPVIWRFRIEDLTRVLDELDLIEASVPGLAGRLDYDRIAVAGHSWGATTASALLGARIAEQDGNVGEDMSPALLLAGDQDQSPLSTRGPDWWTDAYVLSPGEKSLLTLFGAEHTMGGIAGYSVHETTDWSLERITLIQQVTTAYLRSALKLEAESWSQVRAALANDSHPLGRLQSK